MEINNAMNIFDMPIDLFVFARAGQEDWGWGVWGDL